MTTFANLTRLAVIATLMSASTAYAAVIYRWVDESGRTRVSDVVPDKYRRSAEALDCATWRRLYREGQECFAPYHNVNGSLKPGAYGNCAQVIDPEPTCGPESWYRQ
jgi:hypothetical protein